MNRGLLIALVLLVALLGLPLAHGMAAMPACPSCRDGVTQVLGMCLAIIVLLALAAPALRAILRTPRSRLVPLLLASAPDKPPRGA